MRKKLAVLAVVLFAWGAAAAWQAPAGATVLPAEPRLVELLALSDLVIAEGGTGPQHCGEPPAQHRIGPQRGGQLGVPGQPVQRGQCLVGVGRGSHRGQQIRTVPRRVQAHARGQPLRPGRVGEAHPGQLGGHSGAPGHAHPSTVTGARVRGGPGCRPGAGGRPG